MASTIFALVDCNNFFVSCERIFRPDLEGKPVIVMSSNDGCAIARSNEAKKLGIPMGAPMFKYKEIIDSNSVTTFSANFGLYGDISRRITEYLSSITPSMEVYSIDESFLDLSSVEIKDYANWAQKIKQEIMQKIGIPVSVGVAPTKTLAKLASEIAKTTDRVELLSGNDPKLSQIKLENIWGVGRKYGPRLRTYGLDTAGDVAKIPPQKLRTLLHSVAGERLVLELNGTSCHKIEIKPKPQKVISSTRTFGHDTNNSEDVESALASLASRACHRLRQDNQQVSKLTIFATSNRLKDNYKNSSRSIRLDFPSSNTGQIIALACHLFGEIYSNKIHYHRAGVILTELSSDIDNQQVSLIDSDKHFSQTVKNDLMKDIDGLNKKFGKDKVHYLKEDLSKTWIPRKKDVSPNYTTSWQDLPKIH